MIFHVARAKKIRRFHLLSHRGSTSLSELGSLLTFLMHTLGQELSVLVGSILGCLGASSLQGNSVSLVLHALGGDESLDLRGLGVWLSTLFLGDDLSSDNEFARDKC